MDSPTNREIVDQMRETGGSFARALAAAWYKADSSNKDRIQAAFPDLWIRYAHAAEHTKRVQLNTQE